jgi:hypothetical protein
VKRSILPLFLITAFAQPAFAAQTITVLHGKVPAPTVIDLGPVGDSVGDERIWHFLGTLPDNSAVSIDFIMITTALSDQPDGLDRRMTDAVFSFGEGSADTLLVHGIGLYPKNGSTVKVSQTLERAIIGGTGKYAGANGSVSSTHLADGTWQHVFNVK